MSSIQLAIGTADGISVCDHLARSTSFQVFHVEDGRIAQIATRARAADGCGNHKTFVELLEGCVAVICGGIGEGAVKSLRAHGIEPLVLAEPATIEDALSAFTGGTLRTTGERVCLCHEPTTP